MECPHCGSEQSPSNTFCGACGASLSPGKPRKHEAITVAPPPKGRKQIVFAICVLLVCLMLIVGKSVSKNLKISRLDRQMNRAVEDGSYAEALNNAHILYDLTGDEEYLESAKEIKAKADMRKELDRTSTALQDGDFLSVLQILRDAGDRRDLLPGIYDGLKKHFYADLENQVAKYKKSVQKTVR